MSSPSQPVDLTAEATDDYEDILLHSLLGWGVAQKDAYKAILDGALQRLGRFPELGRVRDDLFPGARILRVRQHTLVYRIDPTAITVVRILHVRMDLEGAFAE